MTFTLVTLADRPDLADEAYRLGAVVWPPFMLEDPVANRLWARLETEFPEYQVLICDGEKLAAVANTIPLVWDGTVDGLPEGWDAVLEQGFDDKQSGRTPNTLSALSMTVGKEYQGMGLSSKGLKAMKAVAAQHALTSLIAPARPTLKNLYPLTPIERYINWRRADGTLFDPWLRTHAKIGGEIMKVAPRSMVIPGTIGQWEEWTPLSFPESGTYIVPGALEPVTIDRERNEGIYIEPNVWMLHSVSVMDLPALGNVSR